MKILLLNHNITAQHKISVRLQSAGALVLVPGSAEEAWKMIQSHGPSLDLAVIHREGEADGAEDVGLQLISRVKAEPAQADLPIIFTSSLWNETDFVEHQKSPLGVNAYLRWPFTDDDLVETIETMFGNSIRYASSSGPDGSAQLSIKSLKSQATPPASVAGLSVVLEEASELTADPSKNGTGANAFALKDPTNPSLNAASLGMRLPSTNQQPANEHPVLRPSETGQNLTLPPGTEPAALELQELPLAGPTLGTGVGNLTDTTSPVADLASGGNEGTLDIAALMNQDLEPHERFELELQLKNSQAAEANEAAAAVGDGPLIMTPFKAEPDEPGTTALDPEEMGIHFPAEPQVTAAPVSVQAQPAAPADEETGHIDDDLVSDLPYLFPKKPGEGRASAALVFAEAVGDAVVPGGAVQAPDIETLKKYLMLREQDVAILSNQLRAAREQAANLEKLVKEEKGRNGEFGHTVVEQKRRIDEFAKEKALALEGLHSEIDELRFQSRTKADKARVLEVQVKEATDEIERLKERVRGDIRKIRVREKELENKLEIVRKDSEALITSRETKIMELKRKIDLLEFNMDLLQDQNAREKENSAQLRERLAKAAQVVRVAGGLLDSQKAEAEAVAEKSRSPGKQSREAS